VVRNPALVERLRQQLPRENLWVTTDLSEVAPALETLAEIGIDTLVLVGGDGSVTRTLTPLVRVWPHASLPRVLLAGGGSINTIAKSLGVHGRPDLVLARLLDGSVPAQEDVRPLLRIRADGTEPISGMIFANGAAPRWLEFYYAHTSPGVLGAAYGVTATLGSVVVGGELAQQIFGLFEAQVEIDGKPMPLKRFTAMAAGGVRHIGLGFQPFTTAGQKSGCFHWAATDMGGWSLGLRIPALRLGLESALASLAHASPKRVVVQTSEPMPYTVDAELFPGVTSLSIEAGPEIRFLAV
jgi:diacylglycerol kinase family enzyme